MIHRYTKKARKLRKSMTDAERKLWHYLRNKQLANLKFRRQHQVGPYFLDFYCPEKKIVVEVDGGQHYSPKGKYNDKIRENFLKKRGLRVLRYSNCDVLLDVEGVLEDIVNEANNN